MILEDIVSKIMDAKNVAIMPHISVDGDGLGSSLGLGLTLRKLGKEVRIYLEEEVPYVYGFLPGLDMVEVYKDGSLDHTKNYDIAVALDTGDLGRLGKRVRILQQSKVTANIDHHATNSGFADFNYVQTSSSAVGEMVHDMIRIMGQSLDADISTCLYVAIATDTGGFKFSNTTELTHRIVAELIKGGVDVAKISQRIFDTTSLAKTKLMGEAIGSLELLENQKLVMIVVTDQMLEKAGAKDEDCDGIVSLGRNIRGVEVSVMMRQRGSGEIKVNLRSKEYVDVAAIASRFGGGGHKKAAGCIIEGKTLEEAKKMLIEDIGKGL